ncbi:MAG: hypothetical protein K0R77_1413 [Chryseobacterium sp.]|jgi:hypothetical protein|uniref:hypothetical protein n=1 Tax=Chryseobacterium sp. TaxID=1871047 RepID=UPI0026061D6F|nr:hypothetical protein [Chryseobacterium sp.]MDF2552138.1 hypothetical protein [Chryseobacterium sp.]
MDKNQDVLNPIVDINEWNENNRITNKNDIDWGKMKVYEQLKDRGVDFDIYEIRGGEKGNWDDPVTSRMPPENAFQMIQEFYSTVSDKYEKHISITKTIADELFVDNEDVKIFFGENNEGLLFMAQNTIGENYYIISNCESKIEITEEDFLNYKSVYDEGLKSVLDEYIKEKRNDESASNTKRFVLGNIVYNELLKQQAQKPSANIVISFYPAIHMRDILDQTLSYKNRFTCIMILEERNGRDFTPISETGVFDRNGLCPPPDNSTC